jgi:hypothetical protein
MPQEICETRKRPCQARHECSQHRRFTSCRKRLSIDPDAEATAICLTSKQPRVQPELLFKLTVCPFEVGERIQNNRSRSLCLFTSNQLLTRYHCHILLLLVPSLQNPYSIFQAPSLNSSLSPCVTDIPATMNALTLRSSGTIAPQQRLI